MRIMDWVALQKPGTYGTETHAVMARDALKHVSLVRPNAVRQKYAGIVFGVAEEHPEAFVEPRAAVESTNGRRYFL